MTRTKGQKRGGLHHRDSRQAHQMPENQNQDSPQAGASSQTTPQPQPQPQPQRGRGGSRGRGGRGRGSRGSPPERPTQAHSNGINRTPNHSSHTLLTNVEAPPPAATTPSKTTRGSKRSATRSPPAVKPDGKKIRTGEMKPSPKAASSRSIPSKPRPKIPGFLRLPPELRWKIYQHLFIPRRMEILRVKDPNPARKGRYRLYNRECNARHPENQQLALYRRVPTRPLTFLTLCRVTYVETLHLLYSTTQFVFGTTRAASRFLACIHKDAQAAIRHVEMNQVMYSEPRLTEYRKYKHRSDLAFFDVCEAMAKTLTSLSVLHIKLTIHDWPISMEKGERWSWPLMQFNLHGNALDYASIQLVMPRFDRGRLEAVARELEKELMKPSSFEKREKKRLSRKMRRNVKARRVLRLV